jgi:glycosyltransferase involved in cell wall biosynthesis
MKHVLSICPYRYLPYTTGGEKYISQFNEHLGAISILHVAGVSENDSSIAKGYQLHHLLGSSRLRYVNFALFFSLKMFIKREGIQTIIVEHPYMGWLGILLKITTQVQMIVHTHNVEYQRFKSLGKWWWWLLKYYEKAVLQHADMIFCISEDDRNTFINILQVNKNKCAIIPFGINIETAPIDKEICKKTVSEQYGFDYKDPLLLFIGSMDYKPNIDALNIILNKINPRLVTTGIKYNILVAGKGLSDDLKRKIECANHNVTYLGFIEDLDMLVKAADISLNPIESGGGVKTKVIESIGLNTDVVSTKIGATGIDPSMCGQKLRIVEVNNWDVFSDEIIQKLSEKQTSTPGDFYKTYAWMNIEKKLSKLV